MESPIHGTTTIQLDELSSCDSRHVISRTVAVTNITQPSQFTWTYSSLTITWDIRGDELVIKYDVKTTGWISFGLSPNGAMTDGDFITGWVDDTTGDVTILDTWSPNKSIRNTRLMILFVRREEFVYLHQFLLIHVETVVHRVNKKQENYLQTKATMMLFIRRKELVYLYQFLFVNVHV